MGAGRSLKDLAIFVNLSCLTYNECTLGGLAGVAGPPDLFKGAVAWPAGPPGAAGPGGASGASPAVGELPPEGDLNSQLSENL